MKTKSVLLAGLAAAGVDGWSVRFGGEDDRAVAQDVEWEVQSCVGVGAAVSECRSGVAWGGWGYVVSFPGP